MSTHRLSLSLSTSSDHPIFPNRGQWSIAAAFGQEIFAFSLPPWRAPKIPLRLSTMLSLHQPILVQVGWVVVIRVQLFNVHKTALKFPRLSWSAHVGLPRHTHPSNRLCYSQARLFQGSPRMFEISRVDTNTVLCSALRRSKDRSHCQTTSIDSLF